MANTTTVEVPHAVNNFYDRALLDRATPLLIHNKYGQIRDIPKKNTNVIKFRKYGALAVNTTALTEGVTPAGKQLSVTDITATVSQYGDYVTLTDWVVLTTLDPILTETAEVLGEQAGQSLDVIIRDIINAGTSVQYCDVTSPKANAARTDVVAADVIAADEIMIAVRTLKNNNAPKITRMVNPDTGYATTPVNACFVGIVHPNTTFTLKGETGWDPIETYQRALPGGPMQGEVGRLDEVRFVETTQAKVFTGGGGGGIDVYSTLVLGRDAYGVTRISGEALRNIVKPLGSAGTADPLNQRTTSGWKATLTAVILQQLFMLRLEHSSE